MFLGYPYGKKGWKLYDLDREVFFVSRDVTFQEDVFLFATTTMSTFSNNNDLTSPTMGIVTDNEVVDPVPIENETTSSDAQPNSSQHSSPATINTPSGPDIATEDPPGVIDTPVVAELPMNDGLGQGKRQKIQNVRLRDCVVGSASVSSPSLPPTSPAPPASSGPLYHISDYLLYD